VLFQSRTGAGGGISRGGKMKTNKTIWKSHGHCNECEAFYPMRGECHRKSIKPGHDFQPVQSENWCMEFIPKEEYDEMQNG
jgi:hypothetical protein